MAARQAFQPFTSAMAATASTAYMLSVFGIGFFLRHYRRRLRVAIERRYVALEVGDD